MSVATRFDTAIDIVTDLFIRKGYDHASIEDVVQATGLNRYALYQNFGGKRELLLAALQRHHEGGLAQLHHYVRRTDAPVLPALRRYFDEPIHEIAQTDHGAGHGSFMCQIAFSVAPRDELVRERLLQLAAEKSAALADILTQADKRGELAQTVTPEIAANLLMTTLFGLAAQAQVQMDEAALAVSMDAAFQAITKAPPSGQITHA